MFAISSAFYMLTQVSCWNHAILEMRMPREGDLKVKIVSLDLQITFFK